MLRLIHVLSVVATLGSFPLPGSSASAAAVSGHGGGCSQFTEPIWKETIGNGEEFPYEAAAVTLTGQAVDEVTFTVAQLWNATGLPMVAVHYRTVDGAETCALETTEEGSSTWIPFAATQEFTAQCSHGYAEVGIYIYVGDAAEFDVHECDGCVAPDDNYVGYYLSLPCIPVCEPEIASECFSAPFVHLADIGHEQICIYEHTPIVVEETNKKTASVEFTIANTWPGRDAIAAMSVSFTNSQGEHACQELDQMEQFSETAPFEAYCENGMAEIIVQVHSQNIHHNAAYIPDACSAPSGMGTCSYGTYDFITTIYNTILVCCQPNIVFFLFFAFFLFL